MNIFEFSEKQLIIMSLFFNENTLVVYSYERPLGVVWLSD